MPFIIVGLACLGIGSLFGFTVGQGLNTLFYLLLCMAAMFGAYQMGWIN